MDALNSLIVSLAGSPWVLAVVLLLVIIDGFFPPMPSESVVVALAAVGAASGFPNPWLILLVAALGSFLGDNIAFLIGRRVDPSRFRLLRGKRASALVERARTNLERSPGAVILTARFIPVGRVVVNVLAGASGFSRRRFLLLSGISAAAWAGYSILIGVVAGSWIHTNPTLGAGLAIVLALIVGIAGDRIGRVIARCRDEREAKSDLAGEKNVPTPDLVKSILVRSD